MQTDPHWQEQTLARFILASRRHLGLMQAAASPDAPRRVAGSTRKLLRSLVVASSLGALFGAPAFATEASRERARHSPNEHDTQVKADDRAAQAHRLSRHGQYR
ncbi:MAG: hypothetical protein JNJ95_01915 [Dechloromonas sp.]|nr:hypothetical protein [Dechloromonas sp.]